MTAGLRAYERPGEQEQTPPAVRAWRTECAGWLALGRAPEARGIYQVAQRAGLVIVRRDPRAGQRLPAIILIGDAAPGEPAKRLATALDMLGPTGEPVYVTLSPDALEGPWEAALASLGFHYDSTQLLMTCPLPRPAPEPNAMQAGEASTCSGSDAQRAPGRWAAGGLRKAVADEIQVCTADDGQDRQAALDVVGRGFGDPPALAAFYNPRGVVRLYLARWKGEPAAAAALWPFAGVAGIYSVTTLPQFRGQGLAYALVERILHDAALAGFDLASLRTTHDLESLYARHGFTISGYVRRYRRPR